MERTNICGLSRNELTAAGMPRPVNTLDSVRLDAKHSGSAVVIECVGRGWLIVMPGGMVIGTGGDAMGAYEAEDTARRMVGQDGYNVVVDRVVGR